MTLRRDLIPQGIAETLAHARRLSEPLSAFRRDYDLFQRGGALELAAEAARQGRLIDLALGSPSIADRAQAWNTAMTARWQADRLALDAASGLIDRANRIAELSAGLQLPSVLDRFRTPTDDFVEQILRLSRSSVDFQALGLPQSVQIEAFTRASAMANVFAEHDRLTRQVREAVGVFSLSDTLIPSLSGYRDFLDASGLRLSRWPRARLLSKAEKRRRLRARLQANAAPSHVRRAKTLVHGYELTLRDILDAVMAETYGEDWAEERLPLCDCKDLLGRWKARGGEVLDHADYAHYARIMSHPEHFEAIFEAGFDDPGAVFELLKQAGSLRAASHHARTFTPEDLRDLTLTWRQIETGLIALTPDYELEWDEAG